MMNIMIDKRTKLIKMKEIKMIPPASSVINDDRYVRDSYDENNYKNFRRNQ